MARALQQAEYNGQEEGKNEFVPLSGPVSESDLAYDAQIAQELQLQQWQEEEKKKPAKGEEDKAEGEGEKGEEEQKGDQIVESIEGVDMDALKKFIAKEVQRFFDQKLSEILNPCLLYTSPSPRD